MPLSQARLASRELRSAIHMHTGFIITTFQEIRLDEESSTAQLFCLVQTDFDHSQSLGSLALGLVVTVDPIVSCAVWCRALVETLSGVDMNQSY